MTLWLDVEKDDEIISVSYLEEDIDIINLEALPWMRRHRLLSLKLTLSNDLGEVTLIKWTPRPGPSTPSRKTFSLSDWFSVPLDSSQELSGTPTSATITEANALMNIVSPKALAALRERLSKRQLRRYSGHSN